MNVSSATCAAASALLLPPAPPPPPLAPPGTSSGGGLIFLGVMLCLVAVGLIVLGTNVQRYGLTVVADRGCCGGHKCKNTVWILGWLIYACGNAVYTVAVWLAPVTLCAALLGTAVIWNAVIARVLLSERLAACDVQGGLLIVIGMPLLQVFGPTDSVEYTAPQFVALLSNPPGLAYLACVVALILVLMWTILAHERHERLHGGSGGSVRALMPFAYPVVVGAIESLMNLCLAAVSRMFYRSVAGDDQLCHPAFWVVLGLQLLLLLLLVWWLRKALIHLEVTRVLPIEYGTVSALSIPGSVAKMAEQL